MDRTGHRYDHWVYLLIAVHLAIALPFALFLNIWADEASTLYATDKGLEYAFRTAAGEQRQAPLYFWLLSIWRLVNDSAFFARLFSILCSLAAIRIFYGLSRALFRGRVPIVLTAFFALHPFLIWASLEIRVYSLVVLLSVVLLRLYLLAFFTERDDRSRPLSRVVFLITVIVSLYTNYYLGFLIAGLWVGLFAARRWREAAIYAAMMVPAALAFLPILVEVQTEMQAKRGGFQPDKSVAVGIKLAWNNCLTFLWPSEVFPTAEQSWFSAIRLWAARIIAVIASGLLLLRIRLLTDVTLAMAATAGTVVACYLGAYFLVGPEYVVIRHAAVLFAVLLIAVGLAVSEVGSSLPSHIKRALGVGAAVVLSFSFVYSIAMLYPYGVKRGDWERVGDFIESNEGPGQPIIAFPTFDALPLRYSYDGVNAILPDERYFDFQTPEGPPGTTSHLARETDFIVSEIPPGAERIWLVVNEKCQIAASCTPLQNYIEANYTTELEHEFYLEKVYLLRRRQK